MIINLLRDYLTENFSNYYVHENFFEMYMVALSKEEPEDMVRLMKGLLAGEPNKIKFETIARNCYHDLKDFDKKKSNY